MSLTSHGAGERMVLAVPLSSIHWSSPMASTVTAHHQPHLAFYKLHQHIPTYQSSEHTVTLTHSRLLVGFIFNILISRIALQCRVF